jgi:molybdopterin/thiamine biosynthesis adenylyltransferase
VLREDQIRRYARHVLLPDVGGRGQERLLAAGVAVELGTGRPAEVAALAYLAAAGIGRLILTGDATAPIGDADVAGGILYGPADRGRPAGQVARERIAALNPDVEVIVGGAPGDALRLADELDPVDGEALPEALTRAGAAVARLLVGVARRVAP